MDDPIYEGCLDLLRAVVYQARDDSHRRTRNAKEFLARVKEWAADGDDPGNSVMAAIVEHPRQDVLF